MRKSFFIVLFHLIAHLSRGQQFIFKEMLAELNLPAYECYNIIQDKKGYIWICTENGLCRYNGHSIKTFNKDNGLPEGAVYFIKEDQHGIIHLITSKNRIMRIENDSLIEEKYSKSLADFINHSNEKSLIGYIMSTDENGDILITTNSKTFRINNNFSVSDLSKHNSFKSDANTIIFSDSKRDYLVKNRVLNEVDCEKGDFNFRVDFISNKTVIPINIPFKRYMMPDPRIKKHLMVNGITFFSIDNMLVKVDRNNKYSIYKMPSLVLSMYIDKENGLWIGLHQNGLYYYKDISQMKLTNISLNEHSVSGILIDRENSVWCTTLDKSVFYCNYRYVVDHSETKTLKGSCAMLKCIEDYVFFAAKNGNYVIFHNDSVFQKKMNIAKNTDMTDVIRYNHSWYFSNKTYLARLNEKFDLDRFIKLRSRKVNTASYQMDTCGGKLYIIGPSFISVINNDSIDNVVRIAEARIRCMLCYNKTEFLLGCNNGLYKYDLRDSSPIKVNGIEASINKIFKSFDGSVWLATKSGIYTYKDGRAQKIFFSKKIESDIFVDIAKDYQGNMWLASVTELLKISRDKKGNFVIYQYNTSNGILSGNIKHIALNETNVYISTTNGICSFPVNKDPGNTIPPPVFLNAILVNEKLTDYKSEINFSSDAKTFDFKFDALTYKNRKNGVLLYELNNDPAKVSLNSDLHFENLPPGKYKLTVYAINNDGIKSAKPVSLKFNIEKPFWQTAWFIALCIIIFFTMLYFFVRGIIYNIRQKEEEKTRINKLISETQLSALQAQMNPHFIFNAINSIQNYIMKYEKKEAFGYLAKFGKLIRMVLNNSRKVTLPLDQELETLKLYIELEQMRFKDSFEFQLSIEDAVDIYETEVPTMLIQPYVENGIWHGLMNLENERKGILKINISTVNTALKIIIQDNGIGRTRSEAFKKDTIHYSLGMKLTEQRLETIHKIKDYEGIFVSILDLYDNFGNASGTQVELFLPIVKEYD